ncbi:MAG: biopolymer transporter ExbD [Burkholderiales bacterium]|nr:biopolymer transporter ExbD [Burkholderiales bacterium]
MAFGGLSGGSEEQLMGEINTTPLVDVMLVLLIIFMVTAPLFTHAVKIDLPKAQSQLNPEKPDAITLAIDAKGAAFWNNQPVDDDELAARFAAAAAGDPQPELHLRADRDTRYQKLAWVMSTAQNAGISKIGFVTDPKLLSAGE